MRRLVQRSRMGGFVVRIPPRDRELIATLPAVLRDLLSSGDAEDPAVRRLFPKAFLDDDEASAEFDSVVRDDLVRDRLTAVDTMERTLRATRLSEDELVAWLAALNDLRLVLGVRLAVTEEATAADFAGDPEAERAYAVYRYLSVLEEDVVEALSSA